MIRHHPDDALLMALAAGHLAGGPAVVTGAHVEACPRCRTRLRDFDTLGGAMLESIEPAALAPDALARSLAVIDAPRQPPAPGSATAPGTFSALRASLPVGATWPRGLRGCTATRWRWLGPGRRWSRVTLASDPAANVFLLRIAAGKSLPIHGHDGGELTQVLYGAFHDGRERFEAGDFDEADGNVHHQPVVAADGQCVCLATVEGRLAFDGPIARVLGSLVGL